ncbi:hypothetical protein ASG01_11300 [Chryseobacterium sp. Leaf180]|nr:hypothetical protein ASG01_11300 [Chryseobacterium sp. Leaf180]
MVRYSIFVALLITNFSFAQLVQVGGTCSTAGNNSYGPMNSTTSPLSTNRTAVIYPSTQLIGIANQQITSLYFNKVSSTDIAGSPNFKIYLKETDNNDFGVANADWSGLITGAALVYDSNPVSNAAGAAGWKQFSLNTPFSYTSGKNLMVLMEYVNTGNSTNVTWLYDFNSPCVNTSNFNTTKYVNTTTGILDNLLVSSTAQRPAIGFNFPVTCPAPSVPLISSLSATGAVAIWAAGASETSWEYAVLPAAAIMTPTTWSTATSASINLTLNPQTDYVFFVRASCGPNSKSAWKQSALFRSFCGSGTSLNENFDNFATGNTVPLCWNRIVSTTGTQSISSASPASGTRNIYQYSSTTQNPTVVVLPVFSNVNAGTHWLRLKAKVGSGNGVLYIGYVTNASDAGTFNTLQALNINNTVYDATSEYTVMIPSTIPSTARLAVMNSADNVAYYWDDVVWEQKPNCLPPTNLTSQVISSTSGSVLWSASPSNPALGYEFYYSTSSTAPISTTTPSGTVGPTAITAPLNGLAANTTYNLWVRSSCSNTEKSNWVAASSFKTLCVAVNSLSENFDSYSIASIFPDCWARIINGTGSLSISGTTPASGTRNIYQFSSTTQNPTIAVLPPFSNVNAGTNWLRFKAKVSALPGKINVGYVTDVNNSSSFNLIEAITINNTAYDLSSEYTVIIPATVPAGARLAIVNTADGKSYYYDDFYWETLPTCFVPNNVTTGNVTTTSATVQWNSPATAPALGYDVYFSTTNIAPTAATVPSYTSVSGNSQLISPLNPSTSYFVWVRSNCSPTDKTAWIPATGSLTTLCAIPTFSVSAPPAVCIGGQATFTATTGTGVTANWYANATGGNALATGNVFTTPALSTTTNYYVSASNGGIVSTGETSIESNATTGGALSSYMIFTALSDFTLKTVDLFPYSATAGTAGTATITLFSATGTALTSATVNVVGQNSVAASTPQTVTLNFPIAGGASYRLGVSAWTGITNMYRDDTNLSYPYSVPSTLNITGSSLGTAYYYFFYNWKILTGCESPRQAIVAAVNQGCTLSVDDLIKENNDLSIYPNPVADLLFIKSRSKITEVQIFAASGQRVMNVNDKNISSVNLQSLPSGLYLINITLDDGQKVTKKIVKK